MVRSNGGYAKYKRRIFSQSFFVNDPPRDMTSVVRFAPEYSVFERIASIRSRSFGIKNHGEKATVQLERERGRFVFDSMTRV